MIAGFFENKEESGILNLLLRKYILLVCESVLKVAEKLSDQHFHSEFSNPLRHESPTCDTSNSLQLLDTRP